MHNPQQYIYSTINRSTSKETHAFPKANRFEKQHTLMTEAKYSLPEVSSKRACSFGYGNKVSLVEKRCSPSPGTYQSLSEFNRDKKKSSSPTFGMSRDAILFGSYLSEARRKALEMPCPNRYDIRLPRNHIGGTMGIRIETEPAAKGRQFPGPATYNLQTIDIGSPSMSLSKYKNSGSPKYYGSNTMDVKKQRNTRKTGFYQIEEKQFGKSRLSKYKNVSMAIFGREKKMSVVDKWKLSVPGFKYKVFSEFGNNYK